MLAILVLAILALSAPCFGHGTVIFPVSRVFNVYQANPDNPSFPLAAAAVAIDGTTSYYTWNELSRNISSAVIAGLPPGFDYSPWVPDGQLASGGRVDPISTEYPRTYAGLDQVSAEWPATALDAGTTITVDFHATAPHDPSVWDVWMTTNAWSADQPLVWGQMEYLGRPSPVLGASHYTFDLTIPADRQGRHVLWVAWHRDDPVGEVFFSTSDLLISGVVHPPNEFIRGDTTQDGAVNISDPIASLAVLFTGVPNDCADSIDANDDGNLDISDPVYTLAFLFSGQALPPLPYPLCGDDGSGDGIGCDAFVGCP